MKMIDKFIWQAVLVLLLVPWTGANADAKWTDNFAAAKLTAKSQNKFMLLDFTGSDWCGWCIKLDREVFSKNDFKKYAEEKLVLVELDFPRKKKPSKEVQEQNQTLQQLYGVRGYPTIILLDPNGEKIGQTGYKEGGAKTYVEHLESIISPHAAKFAPADTNGLPVVAGVKSEAEEAHVTVRTWTSSSGNTLEARYLRMAGNLVELQRENNSTVRIGLSSLGEADLEYLRSIKAVQ